MNKHTKDKIKYAQETFIQDYVPAEELSEEESKLLEGKLNEKIKKTKRNKGLLNHVGALKNYFLDKDVKWYRKSIVVAAIIYFITPVDAMPDFVPMLGYLDDLGVIAWTIRFLGREISDYY